MTLPRLTSPAMPRRVVVSYLFFCLAAICWLVLGVVYTTQAVIHARSESNGLSQLSQSVASVEVEYIRNGGANFTELVSRLRSHGPFAYCAIVGLDGDYLAHSSPKLVGTKAEEPSGDRQQWGNVEAITYRDRNSQTLREYRVPLVANGTGFGHFRTALAVPTLSMTLFQAAEYAPLTILLPVALVGLGALVLSRQTRPLAEIEQELRELARLPLTQPPAMRQHAPRSAAAIGWNRLAQHLHDHSQQANSPDDLLSRCNNSAGAASDSVLEHLPDGVAVTDSEFTIRVVNPALKGLLGLPEAKNPQGENLLTLFPVADANHEFRALLEPQSLLRPLVQELMLTIENATRYLRIARQPQRTETAQVQGYLWIIRDVTQQKLIDQMRDQFIDAATHELRTPLANIKAYAETLATLDETDLEGQKEFCNTINSEATRLARFVDDLLNVRSLEVGSLSIELQNVDVKRMLQETIERVTPLMEQKDLAFTADLPAKLPEIHADKDKLVATMVNLLGNAAKYTPTGGNVVLRVKQSEETLQIAIEDTGYGIAAEELPKVFEKFFRSADARVAAESGTGLGLPLAREVVRLHGGDITARSEINKGSTFTISIPCKRS